MGKSFGCEDINIEHKYISISAHIGVAVGGCHFISNLDQIRDTKNVFVQVY